MKRFESGEELAKEIGCKPEVLKKTCELKAPSVARGSSRLVDDHNQYAKKPGSDPFGKKVRRLNKFYHDVC